MEGKEKRGKEGQIDVCKCNVQSSQDYNVMY